ncbi:MAG: hypothetical protein QGG54_03605 [Gammaproteobacteria bacterium]|jgi:hypothetical protein|nr:hypothetical protein [Gammaproteobacteria bacterium]MDP6652562.1 hypothetical protein [Gammaproteobacteria bacterium]|tara:strand:- start:276 stop:866 length:591 start_codon:yes stop_codon:yes gene_type:complete
MEQLQPYHTLICILRHGCGGGNVCFGDYLEAAPRLSAMEKGEVAASPMTALQKSAWRSFAIGVTPLAAISSILITYGATESWQSDGLRLIVELIFIAGLAGHLIQFSLAFKARKNQTPLDERDHQVLNRAATYQTGFVVVTLAIWIIVLGEQFNNLGAVPMVYLNLIFGSIVLLNFIGHSTGILLGYWIGENFGQS